MHRYYIIRRPTWERLELDINQLPAEADVQQIFRDGNEVVALVDTLPSPALREPDAKA